MMRAGDSATSGWGGWGHDRRAGWGACASDDGGDEELGIAMTPPTERRGTVWVVREDKRRPGLWWRSDTLEEVEMGFGAFPRGGGRRSSMGRGSGRAAGAADGEGCGSRRRRRSADRAAAMWGRGGLWVCDAACSMAVDTKLC